MRVTISISPEVLTYLVGKYILPMSHDMDTYYGNGFNTNETVYTTCSGSGVYDFSFDGRVLFEGSRKSFQDGTELFRFIPEGIEVLTQMGWKKYKTTIVYDCNLSNHFSNMTLVRKTETGYPVFRYTSEAEVLNFQKNESLKIEKIEKEMGKYIASLTSNIKIQSLLWEKIERIHSYIHYESYTFYDSFYIKQYPSNWKEQINDFYKKVIDKNNVYIDGYDSYQYQLS